MSGANLQHLLAMILYMAAVIGIGVYFAGRANKNAESYFLGGRSLGPWVIQRRSLRYVRLPSDGSARPCILDGPC
mgnify:CR=1 FL=1